MENTPIREIESVAVPGQFFLLGPLQAVVITFGLGSLLIYPALITFDLDSFSIPIGCGILFVGILIPCMVWSGFRAFKRTTYTIYPDRIEYSEGFWIRQWRTVPVEDVIDVALTEGALQRMSGAGTVVLTIDPQKFQRHVHLFVGGGKVEIRNVPQPKEIWELIRSLALTKGGANKTAAADRAGSTAIQEFPPPG